MESREIYVGMGEIEKATFPDMLRSGGLGPCVAVAFYHPQSRSGYLLHEHYTDEAKLEANLAILKRDYGDLSSLLVFATGNSLSSYGNGNAEQTHFDLCIRRQVEQMLARHFTKSQIRVEWLPDQHSGELYLDTATGNFKVEKEPFEDFF